MYEILRIIYEHIRDVFTRNNFLKEHAITSKLSSKLCLQVIISLSFLLLSFANFFTKSYTMLIFTVLGFAINGFSVVISWKYRNNNLCVWSTIVTCCVLFAFFVIYGGNDGFSCLWIVLFPFLAMIVMDFLMGLVACVILQIFLVIVFWTPASSLLCYPYNEQFHLRFPLFFLVTFILGLMLAVSLQKSQFNEYMHLIELEKMTETARKMARYDMLTKLANRRCTYEEINLRFSDGTKPHCVVMGDIDFFKKINDLYGHELGDEVLVGISQCMIDVLPQDYIKSRWGGEEFLIVTNESIESTYKKIEALRQNIENLEFSSGGQCVKVTATFGIAQYYQNSELNEAINTADSRLYIGKRSTKNCTVIG